MTAIAVDVAAAKAETVGANDRSDPYNWVKWQHPEYRSCIARWKYIRDHYQAEVNEPGKVKEYLLQRGQGESNEAFVERCKNADYTNHFAAVVDSLVGQLTGVDEHASRVFGPALEDGTVGGLGDYQTPDTPAHRLWTNIDGLGTRYRSFWASVATELCLTHIGWLMLDSTPGRDPVVRYLEPEAVTNWITVGGRVEGAVIKEQADPRQSLQQPAVMQTRYLVLTLDGYQRFAIEARSGRVMPVGQMTPWEIEFTDRNGDQIVPIRRFALPMRREVGYYLAKKQNRLFNRESDRDNLLRIANFPKFLIDGPPEVYQAVLKALKDGYNVLHGAGHKHTAPDTGPATLATEVLEKKSREYYMTAFREYGDAAAQKTATEIKQDIAAGAGAFLAMLAEKMDEAETWALHIIEQAEFPNKPAQHFKAHVERSQQFAPPDMEVVMDKLVARVFGAGKQVPLGRSAMVQAAKDVAEWSGLPVHTEEIDAAVTHRLLTDAINGGMGLPFPDEVRVRAVAKLVAASGLVNPEDEIELEGGEKIKLLTLIEQRARKLAEAEDTARRREAESFGAPAAAA